MPGGEGSFFSIIACLSSPKYVPEQWMARALGLGHWDSAVRLFYRCWHVVYCFYGPFYEQHKELVPSVNQWHKTMGCKRDAPI